MCEIWKYIFENLRDSEKAIRIMRKNMNKLGRDVNSLAFAMTIYILTSELRCAKQNKRIEQLEITMKNWKHNKEE